MINLIKQNQQKIQDNIALMEATDELKRLRNK